MSSHRPAGGAAAPDGVAGIAVWAALATLTASGGCAGVSGGRYRDTLQKLKKEKVGTAQVQTCEAAAAGVKCQVLAPEKDLSDLIGLARDEGALEPGRAATSEEKVYYQQLVDNAPLVDLARHGPEGLYPAMPFLIALPTLDPATQKIQKATLSLHVVKEDRVGTVSWSLARLRRGVTEVRLPEDGSKKKDGPLVLADANFGKAPGPMFDGLKYLTFKTDKAFEGRRYNEHMPEAGFLDAKIEEAARDKDVFSFDVTAAFQKAQEEQVDKVVLILWPKIAAPEGDAAGTGPTFMFVATRAAAESLRPGVALEYTEPPPEPEEPEPQKGKKKPAAAKKK